MTEDSTQGNLTRKQLKPSTAAAIALVVALLTPVAIDTNPSEFSSIAIIAMTWGILIAGTFRTPILLLNPLGLVSLWQYTILRLLFVLMIYRFYSGKTTLRKCAMVGIASEFQFPIVALLPHLFEFLSNPHWSYIPIIPIPILILTGFVITRIFKPPDTSFRSEEKQSHTW